MALLPAILASLNRLSVCEPTVHVWGFTLRPPTCDRWLYLYLHRFGWLGSRQREFFSLCIQPGMHVVDVGANIGLYALLFWRLVGPRGRVYAVEPDALMASALRDNLARNGASASIFACAAGASLGRAVLHRNAVNSGDNRLGRMSVLVQAGEDMVPVRPLSELIPEDRVDFVKIDVQGWEAEVLSGMSGLIDRNPHVRIYFEFWPQGLQAAGASAERLACVLRDLGLEVRQPRSGGRMVAVDIEALTRTLKPQAYVDLVALREG